MNSILLAGLACYSELSTLDICCIPSGYQMYGHRICNLCNAETMNRGWLENVTGIIFVMLLCELSCYINPEIRCAALWISIFLFTGFNNFPVGEHTIGKKNILTMKAQYVWWDHSRQKIFIFFDSQNNTFRFCNDIVRLPDCQILVFLSAMNRHGNCFWRWAIRNFLIFLSFYSCRLLLVGSLSRKLIFIFSMKFGFTCG